VLVSTRREPNSAGQKQKKGVRQAVAGGRPVPSHHRGLDCAAWRIRGEPLSSSPRDHCPR